MATTKLRVTTTQDPEPTPDQKRAAAIAFAKNFAMRRGLMSGENTTIGDTIPPFVDEKGNVLPPTQSQQRYPYGTVTDIRQIPSTIGQKDLQFDEGKQMWYYDHPQEGYPVYVSHEIAHSTRFNPTRGLDQSIMSYAKK